MHQYASTFQHSNLLPIASLNQIIVTLRRKKVKLDLNARQWQNDQKDQQYNML